MNALAALFAGILFGAGLLVSGMANPQVVLSFLDVTGGWNPSLAFTMGGAIAVSAPAFWWVRRRAEPRTPPVATAVDVRLLAGSALFGVGWGLSGICPGPGLLLLTGFTGGAWLFVASMAAGMLIAGKAARATGTANGIGDRSGL
jgi:uncharacterized membrane protein YedE/YeeE